MSSALVAIDESDISRSLISYSFGFARQEGLSRIDFIHVVQDNGKTMIISDPDHPAVMPKAEVEKAEIRDKLFGLLKQSAGNPENPDVPFDLLVRSGTPYEEIILQAERGNYDILLIGHRGMSNVKRFFMGSVAAKVVRHSPCSVLVFHPSEEE